jgi:hypothetical protein
MPTIERLIHLKMRVLAECVFLEVRQMLSIRAQSMGHGYNSRKDIVLSEESNHASFTLSMIESLTPSETAVIAVSWCAMSIA